MDKFNSNNKGTMPNTAAGLDDFAYIDKIAARKHANNLTNKQLEELTGIPDSTIQRFLRKESPNANFINVVRLICALGLSVDEVVGIAHPSRKEDGLLVPIYMEMLRQAEIHHSTQIEAEKEHAAIRLEETERRYENALAAEKEHADLRLAEVEEARKRTVGWLAAMSIAFGLVVVFILVVLAVDLLNQDVGWFRSMMASFGLGSGNGGTWNL